MRLLLSESQYFESSINHTDSIDREKKKSLCLFTSVSVSILYRDLMLL